MMATMDRTFSSPPAKRQKLPYHHKHRIHHPHTILPSERTILPQDLLNKLLVESIKTVCEEQAQKLGVEQPYIESVALEALRSTTDEFVHRVCSRIRQSMLSARRTTPIGPDFDAAFYALRVPLPEDQLEPYTTHNKTNRPLLPTPPPEDDRKDEFHLDAKHSLPVDLLGPELSRQQDLKKFSFNISSLPPVPSAHTYRDTEVYQTREKDAKKIRERATEEGKLGEQALRKLAGAVKLEAALSTEPEYRYVRDRRPRRLQKGPVLTEEAMFEETMRDLLVSEPGDFELGPVVSCEKQYRMPDEGKVKRRPVSKAVNVPPPVVQKASAANKYNLLPPPLSKAKPPTDDMDLAFEL